MSHSTRKDGPGCAQRRRRVHGTSTPNGRRSSFRDWAAEATDHPREVVEAALAHVVQNKVEAAYMRSDLFERRRIGSWRNGRLIWRASVRTRRPGGSVDPPRSQRRRTSPSGR